MRSSTLPSTLMNCARCDASVPFALVSSAACAAGRPLTLPVSSRLDDPARRHRAEPLAHIAFVQPGRHREHRAGRRSGPAQDFEKFRAVADGDHHGERSGVQGFRDTAEGRHPPSAGLIRVSQARHIIFIIGLSVRVYRSCLLKVLFRTLPIPCSSPAESTGHDSPLPNIRNRRAAPRTPLRRGRFAALRSRVFDLLVYLAKNRDRVVPKDELLDVVWADVIVADGLAPARRQPAPRHARAHYGAADAVRTYSRKGYRVSTRRRLPPPGTYRVYVESSRPQETPFAESDAMSPRGTRGVGPARAVPRPQRTSSSLSSGEPSHRSLPVAKPAAPRRFAALLAAGAHGLALTSRSPVAGTIAPAACSRTSHWPRTRLSRISPAIASPFSKMTSTATCARLREKLTGGVSLRRRPAVS